VWSGRGTGLTNSCFLKGIAYSDSPRNVVTGLSTISLLVELSLPQISPDLSLASLSAVFSSMLLVLGPMVNNKYLTVTSGLQVRTLDFLLHIFF